jgi:hypothetical protein
MILGLILALSTPALAQDGAAGSAPAAAATPAVAGSPGAGAAGAISEAEQERLRKVAEVNTFLQGVSKQFTALDEAARDPKVKALYKPFLGKSHWLLHSERAYSFKFVSNKKNRLDDSEQPLSYGMLKRAGVFDGTAEARGTWFKIAMDRKNDRGHYETIHNDDDRKRYANLYKAFVVLAEFWKDDGTLRP